VGGGCIEVLGLGAGSRADSVVFGRTRELEASRWSSDHREVEGSDGGSREGFDWRPTWRGVVPLGVRRRVAGGRRSLWGRGAGSRRRDLVLFGASERVGSSRSGSSETGQRPGVVKRLRGGLRQAGVCLRGSSEPGRLVTVGTRRPSGLRRASVTSGPVLRGVTVADDAPTSSWLLIAGRGGWLKTLEAGKGHERIHLRFTAKSSPGVEHRGGQTA
jgi:hypothetical protein